jgi:hypothetical protein
MYGVRADFTTEGLRRAEHAKLQGDNLWIRKDGDTRVLYWQVALGQGLDIMLELEDYYKQCTNKYTAVIFTEAGQIKDITKAFHGRRRLVRKLGGTTGTTPMVVQNEYHENSPFVGGTADAVPRRNLRLLLTNRRSDGDGSDSTYDIAKQRLEKIKNDQCCRNPKDFARLRRQPIPATFPGRVDPRYSDGTVQRVYQSAFGSSLYDDGRGFAWASLPLSRCIHPTRSFSNSLIVWPTDQI